MALAMEVYRDFSSWCKCVGPELQLFDVKEVSKLGGPCEGSLQLFPATQDGVRIVSTLLFKMSSVGCNKVRCKRLTTHTLKR